MSNCLSGVMFDETKEQPLVNDPRRNPSFSREGQAQPETAGGDIGFERALTDWIIKHRSSWHKSRESEK